MTKNAITAPAKRRMAMMDGNEACADAAYRLNEVCSIFPITPATPMAELADQWAGEGRANVWGTVPTVIEMESELGASGALHGALQAGSLGTSFTSSQGLLLMTPNMYKIAGELHPCVIHVASRALSTSALTIFGDHQDAMGVRQTGFAMAASASVQDCHDFAAICQAASLACRVPFLHFFDGFRTSHEVGNVELLSDEDLRELVDFSLVLQHRARGMSPDRPDVRGTVQNADVYFQTREAVEPSYRACLTAVQAVLDKFEELTGRRHRPFEYWGHPQAERVVVLMGSGAEAARETVEWMAARGERVGVLQVRLYRPFCAEWIRAALPASAAKIAVLDRTKEPGCLAEPLCLDVLAALAGQGSRTPLVVGGRYGLGGKEFHPGMVKGVLDHLSQERPRTGFTIGITDDLSGSDIPFDPDFCVEPEGVHRAVFYGLGADGTVGANKNTIKIIGEEAGLRAQAYFLYDSKKSGSQTVSHLRFGPDPIRSTYLIRSAGFVACHVFGFTEKQDVLKVAAPGATVLLNSPYGAQRTWRRLPRPMQESLIAKKARLFVIDATLAAKQAGLGGRTNTVLQTCFFAISGVLPRDRAIECIKESIRKTYGRRGAEVVRRNFEAVDATLAMLEEVAIPGRTDSLTDRLPMVSGRAPAFVREVLQSMMDGAGDALPVSALPADGRFPSGTSQWEKRNVAAALPSWNPDLCIQCGNCSFVCPHGCIRTRLFNQEALASAPEGFQSSPIEAKGFPDTRFTLQVYMEDCTGCGLCVESCPVRAKDEPLVRAINMAPKQGQEAANRVQLQFFESLEPNDRAYVDFGSVRGAQFLEPLFEFSGACAGCGETPYLKLITQLFGDRMLAANASGCSSVYSGSLPTTPWSVNHEGRGPAWATSLFEDNAEFGLGMRLAADRHRDRALELLSGLARAAGADLVDALIHSPQRRESEIRRQRERVAQLKGVLAPLAGQPAVDELLGLADSLVRRSVWIIGGDGWAYDIGSAGVDHVLASGRDVNLLVLDNEVYANTGGQASKATPMGAVAKFASTGKRSAKKDLALQAVAYGSVYVARVALGANPQQALTALREAEAYPGVSLVIAYSHCIAHGIPMDKGLEQQNLAVHSGVWPLMRYDPELAKTGENPFLLDSARPTKDLAAYAAREMRYQMLRNTHPAEAEKLFARAAQEVARHWELYEKLAAQ